MEKRKRYYILAVSDDPDIVTSIEEYLSREGFIVLTARSGLDALNRARIHPIDIFIVDMGTPKIEARAVVAEVRKKRPYIAAIMITASRDEELVARAFATGNLDAVIRPKDIKDLKKMVVDRLGIK